MTKNTVVLSTTTLTQLSENGGLHKRVGILHMTNIENIENSALKKRYLRKIRIFMDTIDQRPKYCLCKTGPTHTVWEKWGFWCIWM